MPTATARHVVHLPAVRDIVGRAGRVVVEASVVPMALFYSCYRLIGPYAGVTAALLWSYAGVVRHLRRHDRVPGMLLIGSLVLTARSVVTFMTGSMFLYFLQPTLSTFLVAGSFLVSVPLGRPLTERLVGDFCELPEELRGLPVVRRFFRGVSVMWGLMYAGNAAVTLWLLMNRSVAEYLVVKSLASAVVTWCTVGVSLAWFRFAVRREGVALRFARRPAVVVPVRRPLELEAGVPPVAAEVVAA